MGLYSSWHCEKVKKKTIYNSLYCHLRTPITGLFAVNEEACNFQCFSRKIGMFKRVNSRLSRRFRVAVFTALECMFLCCLEQGLELSTGKTCNNNMDTWPTKVNIAVLQILRDTSGDILHFFLLPTSPMKTVINLHCCKRKKTIKSVSLSSTVIYFELVLQTLFCYYKYTKCVLMCRWK